MRNVDGRGLESFAYPDNVPDSVFEPRIQAAKGVETYDLPTQNAEAKERIRTGLGTDGPIKLRLVALDYEGNLWAFWTGAFPDRKLSHPIRLPGVRTRSPQTFREFTADRGGAKSSNSAPAIHERLAGMAVTPMAKLGETVDLDIPYKGGTAHFHRVPILRIGLLRTIQEQLGTKNM